MYLLTELILFSPLLIYACIRVQKVISRPLLKRLFLLFYVLLFLGYPVAEMISHGRISGWGPYVKTAGDSEILLIDIVFRPDVKKNAELP